ncbi:hypothetical protein L7F22_064320 [Adiantum nelumboides]|nr:hypothetical protein [Adiantum nelumboides]
MDEPVLALVDHGSKINLMSKSLHKKGRWPIDVDHGWRIRAANMLPGDLYGACANVKEKKYVTGIQSDLQGCNVLEPDEIISRIFEEVSYVDMMSELDEINQNRLESGIDFVKVHSMEFYEMLLQLKQGFEEMVEVEVETKYNTIAKKVKPVATPLPEGSNEVIEEASRQPMLRNPKNIGHKFTEETLKQLKIDENGFLTDEEVKCFQEMLKNHGKTFAFEPGPIVDEFAEAFAGRAIYSMGDLYSGYDHIQRALESRDLATMRTPLGLVRMCTLPQGATNSVAHMMNVLYVKWVKDGLGHMLCFMHMNATYKLCELDGTELKVPIARKRVKLFKRQEGEFELEDLRSEPGNEVYASEDEFDDAFDEAD